MQSHAQINMAQMIDCRVLAYSESFRDDWQRIAFGEQQANLLLPGRQAQSVDGAPEFDLARYLMRDGYGDKPVRVIGMSMQPVRAKDESAPIIAMKQLGRGGGLALGHPDEITTQGLKRPTQSVRRLR